MKRIIAIGAIVVALAAVAIYFLYFRTDEVSVSEQKEVWTCPMHPQVISDKPGSCPICFMDLVKREDAPVEPIQDTHPVDSEKDSTIPEGHSALHLSLERQQMIGVKTDIVQKGNIVKRIRASGRLAFDPELYTAQNEYIEAIRNFEAVRHSPLPEAVQSAERMVESARFRLKVLGLADEQIEKLNKADAMDPRLLVGKSGASAWVYADIYEMDLPEIRSGLSVEVSGDSLQGKTLFGTVASVDRIIDPMTRTAKARVLVKNAPPNLRPQSYIDLSILTPMGNQISVPFDAVFDTGTQAWVFITDGQGHFEPRLVTIKAYADKRAVISSGLNGGEKVVTSANFLIDSESRLKYTATQPSTLSCPKGQYWDVPMAMCMPTTGQ